MSLLSNSVYSSVFTYNPNVLTRPYRHLTTKALIGLHRITCLTLDISVLIVRLWRPSMRMQCRYPYEPSEMNLPSFTKVSWLFDKSSNNNPSNDGLSV